MNLARLQRLEASIKPPAREYSRAVCLCRVEDGTLREWMPATDRHYPSLEAWREAHAEIFTRCDFARVSVFESGKLLPDYTLALEWRNCRVPKSGEIIAGEIRKVGA